MHKKMMIGSPHHRDLEPEYVASVFKTAHALTHLGVEIAYRPMEGGIISKQRNSLVQEAVKENCDWLLMVDTDSVFEVKDVTDMMDANKLVIGALYRMKVAPYLPIAYKTGDKPDRFRRLRWDEIPHEPFTVGALGGGLILIKRELLEKLLEQTFVQQYGFPFNLWQRDDGEQLGEDMSFCFRVAQAGEEVWCYPSPDMGHIGVFNARNNEAIMIDDPHYSNEIPGWMKTNELTFLYREARKMDSVVEVGSWKGRSTVALLTGCQGKVYAVDTFEGSPSEKDGPHKEAAEEGKILNEFLTNTKMFKNLDVFPMSSETAVTLVPVQVDMVFIDASHTYEDVTKDLKLWEPKAKKLICGHDWDWPSVCNAVCDYFGEKHIGVHNGIWYVRKDG